MHRKPKKNMAANFHLHSWSILSAVTYAENCPIKKVTVAVV